MPVAKGYNALYRMTVREPSSGSAFSVEHYNWFLVEQYLRFPMLDKVRVSGLTIALYYRLRTGEKAATPTNLRV